MIRKLTLTTTAAQGAMRLDALLGVWLPQALARPLSKATLRRLIMAGAVRVSGRPWRRPGQSVGVGARVVAAVRLDRLPDGPRRDTVATLTAASILYEDQALIAVDKPPGLPTAPTVDPARPHVFGLLKGLLESRGGPAPYLGLHQRLDRDTSGVVLFTKAPAANRGMARLFAEREVVKVYHALTQRPTILPPPSWSSASRLGPVGRKGRKRMATVGEGGADATTDFTLLEALPVGLLVEARPRTGRKHQVRIHLAEAGLPILGDDLYGDEKAAPRLMLHARSLSFRHPLTGASLVIESPYPADFRLVLRALRSRHA